MKKNMGNTDRYLRLMVAVIIVVAYFANWISGTLAIVLGIVALVFLVTSMASTCPAYTLFGISTCKNKSLN